MKKKVYRFYVYIVTNYERTTFYIGISNSIIRRMIEHKYGLGSVFTKKYKTKYLVYYESYKYINDAIAREKELKGWSRKKKIDLIKRVNPGMEDLSEAMFMDYGINETDIKAYLSERKKNN